MENLLALTLADETPEQKEGDGPSFRWRWLGRGVLELTPTTDSELSLLLSTGIHGNETAPVEIVDLLLRALYRGDITLTCRVLVVLGNPPALAQNKRYLVSDINRMFGGRWSQFPQSEETARAAWLENVVTAFSPRRGQCAGILISIPRSARLTMCALACYRSGISPGMKLFYAGWGTPGWRRWSFISRRAERLPILPANILLPWPVRWNWEKRFLSVRTI